MDRVVKKLKSAKDNLEVIIGKEKTIYRYPLAIMAMYSNYIDAMLSMPMKESKSLSISFPDLCPKDWEMMIRFLQPLVSHSMTYDEAKRLSKFYDKYDFPDGRSRCDEAVKMVFHRNKNIQDISREVEAFILADECNLSESRNKARSHFRALLSDRIDRLVLRADHFAKLVPIFQKDDEIWDTLASSMNFSPEDRDEILSNSFFPSLCEKNLRLIDRETTMLKQTTRIKISGAGTKEVNGLYTTDSDSPKTYTRSGEYAGYDVTFYLAFEGDHWKIFFEQEEASDDEEDEGFIGMEKVFYTCRDQSEMNVPPRNGYLVVEAGAYPCPLVSFLARKQSRGHAGG